MRAVYFRNPLRYRRLRDGSDVIAGDVGNLRKRPVVASEQDAERSPTVFNAGEILKIDSICASRTLSENKAGGFCVEFSGWRLRGRSLAIDDKPEATVGAVLAGTADGGDTPSSP